MGFPDHHHCGPSLDCETSRHVDRRPRVVIFDGGTAPSVAILVLPESSSLGTRFWHDGASWEVMATRTGDRVLIARPIEP